MELKKNLILLIYKIMKTDLKLRIKIQDQYMTLWEVIRSEPNYVMFRASVTSGKKNPDGTWDNVNQNFTCFANGEAMNSIKQNFHQQEGSPQRAKIKVSGNLALLPEKRTAMGKNGEYQESIFSNATLNVDFIEFVELNNEGMEIQTKKTEEENIDMDDDIPF
jgi:hypothetical protein